MLKFCLREIYLREGWGWGRGCEWGGAGRPGVGETLLYEALIVHVALLTQRRYVKVRTTHYVMH